MAENIGNQENPEHIRQLMTRIHELRDQCRLGTVRFESFRSKLTSPDEVTESIAFDGFETARALYKSSTDADWVMSLREVGVPAEVILKAWDRKDARARKERDVL